jgi:hypothetical protein
MRRRFLRHLLRGGGLFLGLRFGGRRAVSGLHGADDLADGRRVPLQLEALDDHAVGRRGELDRDLVRLDLQDGLVLRDVIALALEPLAELDLGDGLSHLGYA